MATKPGRVEIPGKRVSFSDFRQIRTGKNAGKIEVTIPPQKEQKLVVDQRDIKSFPTYTEDKTDD